MTFKGQPITNGRLLLSTVGAGAGFGFLHILYLLAKSEPQLLINGVIQWGPLFAICTFALVIVDRRSSQFVDVTRESADANRQLADAVNRIASKDDIAARERDLMLNEMALTLRNVKEQLNGIEDRQVGVVSIARAAAAGSAQG